MLPSEISELHPSSSLWPLFCQYKRKSTIGISYSLFALVMLGNSLYGLSILLKNPEPGQSEGDYVLHHLPWLVGSLGVLSLDVVVSFPWPMFPSWIQSHLWAGRARQQWVGWCSSVTAVSCASE